MNARGIAKVARGDRSIVFDTRLGRDAVARERPPASWTGRDGESLLDCLRDEAALLLEGGARVADVQDELIDAAQGITEDERAALWLFAWAYRPRAPTEFRRRPEAARR
jgi:hypothetical protein